MLRVWEFLDGALFGIALPLLLFGVGCIYMVALRAFPYLHPKRTALCLSCGNTRSALRALSVALGGTLGVGNITGVALAIAAGGAGAVFWMWVSAAVAMFLKYGEVVLSLLYRRRGADGTWEGGAMYYLREHGGRFGGLVAGVFALLCFVCAMTLGAPVQSNAAATAAEEVLGIPPFVVGTLMLALTALAVFGGIRKIARFTERVVPLVSVLYLFLSLWAIFTHLSELGEVFTRIFTEAFSFSAGASGTGGFFLSRALRYGVTRGLLSNEAGAGTAPMAHSVAENTPVAQGVMGLWEVAIDTFVFCTATALPILIAYPTALPAGTGISLVVGAFSSLVGAFAPPVLCISIFFFAYATVLAWCYYGKRAIGYLTKNPMAERVYLYAFVAAVGAGAFLGEGVLYEVTDGVMCLLTMLHTTFLLPELPVVVDASVRAGILGKRVGKRRQGKAVGEKQVAKIARGRCEDGQPFPLCGVGKGKSCGMKHGTGKAVTCPPVKAVTQNGMSHGSHVQADLVGTPRKGKDG